MNSRTGRYAEIVFLLVIAAAVAIGGRALLLEFVRYKAPAIVVMIVLVVGTIAAIRRSYAGPPGLARLAVTKNIVYAVALVLALWLVLSPARWLFGACISAVEVAIAFDVIIAARPPAAGGGPP